jgi:exodeoxyribonuclease-3
MTWNVNSIKTRLDRCLGVLARHEPDVLCVQELKCDDASFPFDEIEAAGYRAAVHGQPTYNGVAIISKAEPERVRRGFDDEAFADSHARLITATFPATAFGGKAAKDAPAVTVVNGYFPNGGSLGSDKWVYKLDWMDRLRRRLQRDGVGEGRVALVGDYNVAPSDVDVAHPKKWRETVLCAEPARRAVRRLEGLGLTDCYRVVHPAPEGDDAAALDEGDRGRFSWWDYRTRGWENNDGLRIDHVFASPALAESCEAVFVDVDEREPGSHESAPSDHAPVVADFAV